MSADPPILAAWQERSSLLEQSSSFERPGDVEKAKRELISFLRRPDFANLTDESQSQFLEFADGFADVLLIHTRDTKSLPPLNAAISVLEECYRLAGTPDESG